MLSVAESTAESFSTYATTVLFMVVLFMVVMVMVVMGVLVKCTGGMFDIRHVVVVVRANLLCSSGLPDGINF
jgi:hypothetical protein